MISFQGIALLLSNSREVVMQGELNFLTANLIEGARDPVTGLVLRIPPYVVAFFVIALIGGLVLTYTKYGRRIYAVGTNPRAAFLAGIDVSNMRLSVYMIQGLLVGIGATMLLARINTGIITLGQGLEIDTIAMVVIGGTALSGGKGNIVGTLIGVVFSRVDRQRDEPAADAVRSSISGQGPHRDHRGVGGGHLHADLRIPGSQTRPGEGAQCGCGGKERRNAKSSKRASRYAGLIRLKTQDGAQRESRGVVK